MTLIEKLRMVQEAGGSRVYFFRRGLFWVLYNQSVYLYSLLNLPGIQNARLKRMHGVGEEVVTLFLPLSLLQQMQSQLELQAASESILYHDLATPQDLVGYEAWTQTHFADMDVYGASPTTSSAQSGRYAEVHLRRKPLELKIQCLPLSVRESMVLERLRSFDFATATPMDAAKLVVALQSLLAED